MHPIIRSIILLSVIAVACSKKDPALESAGGALPEFRRLVTADNYRKLGFESLDELQNMTLGVAIPVYYVGLSEIKQFKPGDDPNKFLSNANEKIYPVLVAGGVRSSVALKNHDGGWQVRSFGRPNLSRALARIRDEDAAAGSLSPSDFFAVEIPSLYFAFIGHRAGDNLLLTHVHDHADLAFDTGEMAPAAEVFAKIAQAAQGQSGALSASQ